MLEFIKIINSDYASVLSLVSSLIMVIVTIIYVRHTKHQANYAKESVELVAKQIKIEKQPCIVPQIIESHGSAFDAGDYIRIQLGFDINLKNIGDAPAINIFILSEIELQLTPNFEGKKRCLTAALLPNFVQAVAASEEKKINIHFETDEVMELVQELGKAMNMNWNGLRPIPATHPM